MLDARKYSVKITSKYKKFKDTVGGDGVGNVCVSCGLEVGGDGVGNVCVSCGLEVGGFVSVGNVCVSCGLEVGGDGVGNVCVSCGLEVGGDGVGNVCVSCGLEVGDDGVGNVCVSCGLEVGDGGVGMLCELWIEVWGWRRGVDRLPVPMPCLTNTRHQSPVLFSQFHLHAMNMHQCWMRESILSKMTSKYKQFKDTVFQGLVNWQTQNGAFLLGMAATIGNTAFSFPYTRRQYPPIFLK
ncbi:hypothetical protein HNY73_021830 [Argiope bruennichi]|uniref:Uncharacterized protein n=1 Tax=Argiope bruennichi TaxID=94029 RepID=A0A8T0DYT5_ARGBR|nr:hypothetical protein HNY73_021830 [Argiope bruennichi]